MVIELTEPQVWVLMGVFATAIFGMLGWQTVSFNRTLTSAIDGLRGELKGEIKALRAEMNGRFEVLEIRMGAQDAKLEALDRDVQALTRRVFRDDTWRPDQPD